MALSESDIQRGGYALNPATGRYELVYAKAPDDYLSGNYSDFSFDPTGRQSLAGWAPGYYTDNGSGGFKDLFTQGVPLTVGLPMALGAGLGALGVGAAGSGATAGVTGLPLAAAPGVAGAVEGLPAAAGAAGATGGAGAAAAASGGPMWDWLDTVDMGGDVTGGSFDAGMGDYLGLGSPADVDAMSGGAGGFDSGMGDFLGLGNTADEAAVSASINNISPGLWDQITSAAGKLGVSAVSLARQFLSGGGGSAAAGGAGAGGGLPGLGEAAFDSTPFLLSAYLANQQRNDINPYIDRINALGDQFAGNQPAYLKSLTDPYDQATAAQYGNLTRSLGNRGVLGSSFGNMDLDNFNYTRDVGRGNLLAQGTAQGIGAQSQLADQAMKAINTRNAGTNALLGAGLNASARLFAPNRDPFGIQSLLGGANG